MMTAISERKREIGILQAIGAPKWTIFSIFFLESGCYGLFGGVLGVVGGILFSLVASPYISQNEFTSLIRGSDIGEALDFRIIFGSIIFSIAISLVSGLYPALMAARMTPVEAISYE
jgi:putative ABC transport system permease protein